MNFFFNSFSDYFSRWLIVDRKREVGSRRTRRIFLWSLGSLITCFSLVVLGFSVDLTTFRIDRDKIRIGIVQRGDFEVKVHANGVLLPRNVEWIASQVEGRVKRLHVYAGDAVTEGQLLLELSNPALVTAADEARSAYDGSRAQLNARRADLQTQLLNQKSLLLKTKFELQSARLQLDAERQLRERPNPPVAEIDFRRTQLNVQQLEETLVIEKEKLEKSYSNMDAQLAAEKAKVAQQAKILERAEDKVADLHVRAGMDGVVQEFPLKPGQRLNPGDDIARIARQDQLYAELEVPARQATDVSVGQLVLIDTRNGEVNGKVSRVDPAVSGGTVIVDVTITDTLPKGTRPELTIDGIIYVAQIANALYVDRPAFSKKDSRLMLYRLDADNQYADRVAVELGTISANRVEVLSGLAAGDQIVLSDSNDWKTRTRINIQ